MKKIIFIFMFITGNLLLTVYFVSCNQPTPPTSNKETANCSLLVSADTNCLIYVDDAYSVFLKTGETKAIKLEKGLHLIVGKGVGSSENLFQTNVDFTDHFSESIYFCKSDDSLYNDTNIVYPQTITNDSNVKIPFINH